MGVLKFPAQNVLLLAQAGHAIHELLFNHREGWGQPVLSLATCMEGRSIPWHAR